MKAAEQDIRPSANSQRETRLRAAIVPRKCPRTQIRSRSSDSLQDYCRLQIADVGAEFGMVPV
jgi:hypothetical protein